MTTPDDQTTDRATGNPDTDPSDALRRRDEEFDLARLGEITGRDGFAVFDPTAPGGVRALRPAEQHALADSIRPDERSEPTSGSDDDGDTGPRSAPPYRADAEWGDPDYREPASAAEAAARTAYVDEQFPATGWSPRANTEIEDALDGAAERAVLSDRAHDPDPQAWAEYHRLLALDQLAPLPTDRDALDPAHGERGQGTSSAGTYNKDTTRPQDDPHHEDRVLRDHLADEAALNDRSSRSGHDGPFTDTQGRRWASNGAWAAGTCDPAEATDTTHPDDPERLRRRLENLRADLAARDLMRPSIDADAETEQRREQLTRWHDDDVRREALGIRAEVGDLRD